MSRDEIGVPTYEMWLINGEVIPNLFGGSDDVHRKNVQIQVDGDTLYKKRMSSAITENLYLKYHLRL